MERIPNMTAATKRRLKKTEPIHERGVLLSVHCTISRAETGPPQKIMMTQTGGSMVKNSPENAVARAKSEGGQPCDGHRSPGTLPRSLAVVAAGLGVGASRAAETEEETAGVNGLKLSRSKGIDEKMRHPDFGDVIGKELQNLYDDLVAQPIPDRFLTLLNQLEKNMVSSGRSVGAPGERE
jgi:hypothetical protein